MTLVDGINQFQICLNEEEVTTPAQSSHTEDDTSEPIIQYQYDFNEFRTDALTEEEVKADPEKYLDYTPIASLPEQEQPASIDAAPEGSAGRSGGNRTGCAGHAGSNNDGGMRCTHSWRSEFTREKADLG